MKAFVCEKYGPPEVLQLREVEKPVPEDNEVLIKVHATTVNAADCTRIELHPFRTRIVSQVDVGIQKAKDQHYRICTCR